MHKFAAKSSIAFILCVAAILGMVSLGFWQLDRMQQKEQRLASIAQKKQLGPSELSDLALNTTDVRDLPVRFVGQPSPAHLMFLDNQIEAGTVGYEVIVPVYTSQGWVLVNYGWVKAGLTRTELPSITISSGDKPYEGVIQLPENNPLITETAPVVGPFPKVIQQLDIEAIQKLTGKTLLPFVVQLTGKDDRFSRQWEAVVMSPQKHLGYALQWFGLAIAASVALFFVVVKRVREHDEK